MSENHCSYFDILLTYSMCPDLTGYVAKAEMLKVPLLRDWMKLALLSFPGFVPTSRKD